MTEETDIVNTDVGFKWNNLEVIRVCDGPQGSVLVIKSPKRQLEVRVTPSGRIFHQVSTFNFF